MARALNVYGRLLAVWSRGANRAPVATATAPAAAVPGVEAAVAAAAVPARRRRRRLDWVFVASVLLPTLLALFYYAHFASDVFISESRFVVRSPQRQMQTGLLLRHVGWPLARAHEADVMAAPLEAIDKMAGCHGDAIDFGRVGFGDEGDTHERAC